MITNKDLGLKIAENREERVFSRYEMQVKAQINELKEAIKESEKILKMDMKTIWKKTRNGAEAEIRRLKDNLDVKEFELDMIKKKTGGFKDHEFQKAQN